MKETVSKKKTAGKKKAASKKAVVKKVAGKKAAGKKAVSKKKIAAKKAVKPLTFKQASEKYKGPLKLDAKLSSCVRGVWYLRGLVAKIDATTGKKVKA